MLPFQFLMSFSVWAMFQSPQSTASRPVGAPAAAIRVAMAAMKRSFSSWRSVLGLSGREVDAGHRRRLRCPPPGSGRATRIRLRRNRSGPIERRAGDNTATPLRPLRCGSAEARCQPSAIAGASASAICASSARVSCRHTTSARVSFSQASRPRLSVERSLTAARMPLTLTVVTITRDDPIVRRRRGSQPGTGGTGYCTVGAMTFRRDPIHLGSGEPILLLHPFLCSQEVWSTVAPQLAGTGRFEVFAPTMVGHYGGPSAGTFLLDTHVFADDDRAPARRAGLADGAHRGQLAGRLGVLRTGASRPGPVGHRDRARGWLEPVLAGEVRGGGQVHRGRPGADRGTPDRAADPAAAVRPAHRDVAGERPRRRPRRRRSAAP